MVLMVSSDASRRNTPPINTSTAPHNASCVVLLDWDALNLSRRKDLSAAPAKIQSAQIAPRFFIERALAARSAEVIRLALVLAGIARAGDFNGHATHRIDGFGRRWRLG